MTNDILTLAALVAAYVGVVKGFGINPKYSPLVALLIAAVFVSVPEVIQAKLILISVIGLSAAGVYSYAKNKDDGGVSGGVDK
jgi:predicted metal-binding membrane protein